MTHLMKLIKRFFEKVRRTFNDSKVTLFGLHLFEVIQTAIYHPEQWGSLHLTITFVLLSAMAKFFIKL